MAHPAPLNRVEASPAPAPVSWTADPIAARILADLAKNPPAMERRSVVYAISREEVGHYVGEPVERLRAIEGRFLRDAMLASDAGVRSEYDEYREADPLHREGTLVPSHLRGSTPVDRVIYEAVQGFVS